MYGLEGTRDVYLLAFFAVLLDAFFGAAAALPTKTLVATRTCSMAVMASAILVRWPALVFWSSVPTNNRQEEFGNLLSPQPC